MKKVQVEVPSYRVRSYGLGVAWTFLELSIFLANQAGRTGAAGQHASDILLYQSSCFVARYSRETLPASLLPVGLRWHRRNYC